MKGCEKLGSLGRRLEALVEGSVKGSREGGAEMKHDRTATPPGSPPGPPPPPAQPSGEFETQRAACSTQAQSVPGATHGTPGVFVCWAGGAAHL